MKDRSNMIWIDLEMTGLDTQRDYIIEIASIVTDKNLNILEEGPNLVITQPDEVMNSMDQWNTDHHTNSGLVQKVRESNITESMAEKQTIDFLSKYIIKGASPLCGNTICQDRRFLARCMPDLESFCHYRSIDVSSIRELGKRWFFEDIDNFQRIRQKRKNIFKEIISYKDLYNEREKDSLIATKNEIFLCMEKLNGLKLHSTPVSLRRYCLIFIYLSPFLFNTKLITEGQFEMSLGIDLPVSILFSITISFILMALYNIQDYIENPFDQKGLDDLQIDQMQIFEKESLYE